MAQVEKRAESGWLFRSIEDGRRYVKANEAWVSQIKRSLGSASASEPTPQSVVITKK